MQEWPIAYLPPELSPEVMRAIAQQDEDRIKEGHPLRISIREDGAITDEDRESSLPRCDFSIGLHDFCRDLAMVSVIRRGK